MMDLLTTGIDMQAVFKTGMTRKLTLDGVTAAYPVFRIRLDLLYYNDQNDRIATWISQYRAEHDGHAPDVSQQEAYNKIIEGFIVDSNPDAMRKTQMDIALKDQREAGVVLRDGRIIDGNRRFTCLRRLKERSEKFGYFEAVILDRNIEHSAKQIKLLELSIQHGEEQKVDYNPVDRLVGIYTDIIQNKLLTVEEYARSTDMKVPALKKRVELAELMADFLDFINAPGKFYIARDLDLTFPLEELQKLRSQCRHEDEWEDLKTIAFNNILVQPKGDMTRFIREFKNVLGSDYQDDFFDEQRELAAQVIDSLPGEGKVNTAYIREVVRGNEEMRGSLERSMERTTLRAKKTKSRTQPAAQAAKAVDALDTIDRNVVALLRGVEKKQLSDLLDQISAAVADLRENL